MNKSFLRQDQSYFYMNAAVNCILFRANRVIASRNISSLYGGGGSQGPCLPSHPQFLRFLSSLHKYLVKTDRQTPKFLVIFTAAHRQKATYNFSDPH
jgi:hypothetical protein